MKIKSAIALVAAAGALALTANAQDNNPPNDGPPGTDAARPAMHQNGGPRGWHLLPPRAEERLKLTDDQKQQTAALEKETRAKLEKILTPEQLKQLENMRPPMRERGGQGQGGFHADGQRPPMGPPPGDDNGNNPPPAGPSDDQ